MGGANNPLNRIGVTATADKNRLICKQLTTISNAVYAVCSIGSMLICRSLEKMRPGHGCEDHKLENC